MWKRLLIYITRERVEFEAVVWTMYEKELSKDSCVLDIQLAIRSGSHNRIVAIIVFTRNSMRDLSFERVDCCFWWKCFFYTIWCFCRSIALFEKQIEIRMKFHFFYYIWTFSVFVWKKMCSMKKWAPPFTRPSFCIPAAFRTVVRSSGKKLR